MQTPNFSAPKQLVVPMSILLRNCVDFIKKNPEKHDTKLVEAPDADHALSIVLDDNFSLLQFLDYSERRSQDPDFKFTDETHIRYQGEKLQSIKRDEIHTVPFLVINELRGLVLSRYTPHFDAIYTLAFTLVGANPGLVFTCCCEAPDFAVRCRNTGTLTVRHPRSNRSLTIETDVWLAGDLYTRLKAPRSLEDYYKSVPEHEYHRHVDFDSSLKRVYDFIGYHPELEKHHPTTPEGIGDAVAKEMDKADAVKDVVEPEVIETSS